MSSQVLEKKRLTYRDYLKTPDDERYELIEGELCMTPSPSTDHQRISGAIFFVIRKHVMEHDLGEVFDAPCDVVLDDENVLQPDILFVSRARKEIITKRNIAGAPDLVVEILSETSGYRDMVKKKRLYAGHGVKEYWIVDPMEKTIDLYLLKRGAFVLQKSHSIDDTLHSPTLKGHTVKLREIFRA